MIEIKNQNVERLCLFSVIVARASHWYSRGNGIFLFYYALDIVGVGEGHTQ